MKVSPPPVSLSIECVLVLDSSAEGEGPEVASKAAHMQLVMVEVGEVSHYFWFKFSMISLHPSQVGGKAACSQGVKSQRCSFYTLFN